MPTAAAVKKPLSLSLLGGLRINCATPLGPASHQPRRLAIPALCAVAGPDGLSRERLIAFLWPEQDDAGARNAFKQAIHALRRDCGARGIFLENGTLRLNPDVVDVDLWRFNGAFAEGRWEDAVDVYQGPLLQGVVSLGSSELEHWIDIERERAAHHFNSAVESAAKVASARGDTRAAMDHWYKLASIDPMNDRAAEAIGRGLAREGNRSGAVQHVRAHIKRVSDQLNIPADADLTALIEELARTSSPARGEAAVAARSSGPARVWNSLVGKLLSRD